MGNWNILLSLMRKHLEDNDSSAVAAVLDQLHEALGDVLDGEEAVVLLQLVSVAVSSFLVLQDCGVRKRGADTLDLSIKWSRCKKSKNRHKLCNFKNTEPWPPFLWRQCCYPGCESYWQLHALRQSNCEWPSPNQVQYLQMGLESPKKFPQVSTFPKKFGHLQVMQYWREVHPCPRSPKTFCQEQAPLPPWPRWCWCPCTCQVQDFTQRKLIRS